MTYVNQKNCEMPIFEFKCDDCKTYQEICIPCEDFKEMNCRVCNMPMQRVFSSPAVRFVWTGFYETDYKNG